MGQLKLNRICLAKHFLEQSDVSEIVFYEQDSDGVILHPLALLVLCLYSMICFINIMIVCQYKIVDHIVYFIRTFLPVFSLINLMELTQTMNRNEL